MSICAQECIYAFWVWTSHTYKYSAISIISWTSKSWGKIKSGPQNPIRNLQLDAMKVPINPNRIRKSIKLSNTYGLSTHMSGACIEVGSAILLKQGTIRIRHHKTLGCSLQAVHLSFQPCSHTIRSGSFGFLQIVEDYQSIITVNTGEVWHKWNTRNIDSHLSPKPIQTGIYILWKVNRCSDGQK